MLEQLTHSVSETYTAHFNALFLLGLILFTGSIGGRLFQRMKIPQVVGYIVAGIILGRSGLNIINAGIIDALVPFNYFALGLIGFMIGGELKGEVFKRYGKQFTAILLSEGLAAFVAVFLLTGILGSLIFGGGPYYWALGLLLGAIASATAPAATTDVLWEYKTKGPLTTTVLGIVALDDGLALILFAIAASIVPGMLGETSSLSATIIKPFYEISFGVLIGLVFSIALINIIKKNTEKDKVFVFSLSGILVTLGLALIMDIDMLLAAMTMGAVLVNREQRLSKNVFKLVSGFAAPFYVLFFVLVGAKFDLYSMSFSAVIIAVLYLLGRTAGKMAGARFGAKFSGAPKTVMNYLPYCLFSQAGVAIGLSILASNIFPGTIGSSIIIIIALTTFVVQLLGPPCVKYAVVKAGETGLNISEEDILNKSSVEQLIDKNPPFIYASTALPAILNIFAASSYHTYPVVDKDKKLLGVITLDSIRQSFANTEAGNLILAHDIMEPPIEKKLFTDSSLLEARDILDKYHIDYLPIVSRTSTLLGFLEKNSLDKFVSEKLIEAEQKTSLLG